jgi:hypothetical protein
MAIRKPVSRSADIVRELSERELNDIMKAMGKKVRAQSADQKSQLKKSLIKEIASARKTFIVHDKKNS